MLLMGFLTFIGFILLLIKLSPRTLKRLVGANFFTDLILTFFFIILFAATGTFAGMMTGIIAGLMVSVALLVAKWVIPHEKLTWKRGRPRWEEVKPSWIDRAKTAWRNRI